MGLHDGEPRGLVQYLGLLAKRPAPRPNDFIVIAPGESLTGSTELTRHYDMAAGGEYLVSYRMDLLDGVQADELRSAATEIESNAVAVWREAPMAVSGIRLGDAAPEISEFSLAYTNCSSSQQSAISSAVSCRS